MDDQVEKWKGKYGQEVADQLKGFVEKNMPNYEYLCQYKV